MSRKYLSLRSFYQIIKNREADDNVYKCVDSDNAKSLLSIFCTLRSLGNETANVDSYLTIYLQAINRQVFQI